MGQNRRDRGRGHIIIDTHSRVNRDTTTMNKQTWSISKYNTTGYWALSLRLVLPCLLGFVEGVICVSTKNKRYSTFSQPFLSWKYMNELFYTEFWLLPTPTLRPLLPALCVSTHSNIKWLWLVCLPHFWSITSDINNVPLDKTFACLMRLEAERADPESLFTTQLRLAWGRYILINKLQITRGWCSMSLCLFSHNLGHGNEIRYQILTYFLQMHFWSSGVN